jgi:hypothetical protein
MKQLMAIMQLSYLETGADVIRAALHAYDDILYLDQKNYKIIVKDKSGEEFVYSPYTTFRYPGLDTGDRYLENNAGAETGKATPKNFFFTGEAVDRLESIKAQSFMKSNADVIRLALTAYSELLTIDAKGDEIVVRNREGIEQVYSPHRPWPREEADAQPQRPGKAEGVKERTLEHI